MTRLQITFGIFGRIDIFEGTAVLQVGFFELFETCAVPADALVLKTKFFYWSSRARPSW
ncbi:hypothetical protein [Geobacter sp. FeAm09]|uniref:hypothetical protein n=1 Tax=Geobacter sp. FeAm09 TaxID=2597769 RepID=UPI00197AD7CA|nr:hypothetical protein [Geobacter sp. FeAm09]